ncbi:flavin reductase [Cryptosporangium sp. NPDC051539]|uniref:flavin reductase n=1 Tax=Cryptosporangium sp. NPDC051539 TaxID=3363962 RepID=UPI00378A0192
MSDANRAIDSLRFREVLGHYPTGVTVVTGTADNGSPIGMVVGTFTSVSLDPPLVAFLPTLTSRSFARLREAPAFCINVLAHDQVELCRAMSKSSDDKFSGVDWKDSDFGAPMLTGAVAHIHCTPRDVIEAGDHYIQLCEVTAMDVHRQVTPLLFFQGGYGGFSPHGMIAGGDADLIAGVHLADVARPHIEALAREVRCEAAVLVAVTESELTTVATAHGGDAVMRELIGERLPMKLPLGEAYVAWADDEAAARWLSMVGADPHSITAYTHRLEAIRARGYTAWQIATGGRDTAHELDTMMKEYKTGGLTPTRERALLTQMAEAMQYLDTGELDEDARYDIGGLMAPVLREAGGVAMLLRLAQLPSSATGRQVKQWADELRAAATAVEPRSGNRRTNRRAPRASWPTAARRRGPARPHRPRGAGASRSPV